MPPDCAKVRCRLAPMSGFALYDSVPVTLDAICGKTEQRFRIRCRQAERGEHRRRIVVGDDSSLRCLADEDSER